jgi:hypothetical protein
MKIFYQFCWVIAYHYLATQVINNSSFAPLNVSYKGEKWPFCTDSDRNGLQFVV